MFVCFLFCYCLHKAGVPKFITQRYASDFQGFKVRGLGGGA